MSRIFDNPENLRAATVLLRVRKLDPLATIRLYNATTDGGTVVAHYIDVESSLSNEAIIALLNSGETSQEATIIQNYIQAASEFENLPNWATWTPDEASVFINTNIMNGLSQSEVDAQIDALPATIAGMKTGLKQTAIAIIAIRSILQNMARAIVFLRNLIVSVRR